MYLTEKVARKKECPISLKACEAAGCMMWRWTEEIVTHHSDHNPAFPSHGYCGVGEKPEVLQGEIDSG